MFNILQRACSSMALIAVLVVAAQVSDASGLQAEGYGVSEIPLSSVRSGDSEYVGALQALADGTVAIAMTDPEDHHSRILLWKDGTVIKEMVFPDIGVNRFGVHETPSHGEVLLLSGGTGEGYETRVYDLSREVPSMIWSSSSLSHGVFGDIGSRVVVNPSLECWAFIGGSDDESKEVLVGDLEHTAPVFEITVESSIANDPEIDLGVSADFPQLQVLEYDADGDLLLAVSWLGSIALLQPGPAPLKAVFRPDPAEVGAMHWQSSKRLLWVHHGARYSAYSIPSQFNTGDPADMSPVLSVTKEDLGFAPNEIEVLQDGNVVLSGIAREPQTGEWIAGLAAVNTSLRTPRVNNVFSTARGSTGFAVDVSATGNTIVVRRGQGPSVELFLLERTP